MAATHGRRHLIRRLVEAVLADPGTTEFVVVVDGSNDGTAELLHELARFDERLRPVVVSHRGQLRALDAGLAAATGDVVVLLDDDVVPCAGLISGHALHHRERTGMVIMGWMPVHIPPRRECNVATLIYSREYDGHIGHIERGELDVLDGLWAGNISLRRADAVAVGMGNFPVFYHADRDLGLRLKEFGLAGVFDRTLRAEHLHAKSSASFVTESRQRGQASVFLGELHPGEASPVEASDMILRLPRPVLRFVLLAASTDRAATSVGRALVSLGQALVTLGVTSKGIAVAKLGRRVMMVRGMRDAEARHVAERA